MRSQRLRTSLATAVAAGACAALLWSCYQPTKYEAPDSNDIDTSRTYFVAGEKVAEFVGEKNVKLAYTLKGNQLGRRVYYVDLNTSNPQPKMLKVPAGKENINADSPLFSPDGNFVTYFMIKGNDGYGVYVQALSPDAVALEIDPTGVEPHWWTDPASGQLYIVYSTQFLVRNGALSGLKDKAFTYRVPITINGLQIEDAGDREQIAPYPMSGGMSRDGSKLCTGYGDAAFYDRNAGQLVLLNEGYQVCNPSITPSASVNNLMMFLNFQGEQNLSGTHSDDPTYPADASGSIDQHDVIFIVDETNTVWDFIPVVDKYIQWQDPEWSNLPNFATALGDMGNGTEAVIINLETRENLVLTPHDDYKLEITSTPSMWAATKPLNLTYPTGGEEFNVGDTVVVKWEVNSQNVTNVVVKLFKNAGSDLPIPLTSQAVQVSGATQFEWVIEAGQEDEDCVLGVYDNLDPTYFDVSGTFAVNQ
jgi:hypothetical protein